MLLKEMERRFFMCGSALINDSHIVSLAQSVLVMAGTSWTKAMALSN